MRRERGGDDGKGEGGKERGGEGEEADDICIDGRL